MGFTVCLQIIKKLVVITSLYFINYYFYLVIFSYWKADISLMSFNSFTFDSLFNFMCLPIVQL